MLSPFPIDYFDFYKKIENMIYPLEQRWLNFIGKRKEIKKNFDSKVVV
jgi:hypothetical protein